MRKITPLFFSFFFLFISAHAIPLSPSQAEEIGRRIWKNECNQKIEGLLSWNEGEEFASLGIGHFIWYPSQRKGRFVETFPSLIQFLQEKHIPLPDWLNAKTECPWKSKQEFNEAKIKDPRLKQLETLLVESISYQALFIHQRFEKSIPLLTEGLSQEKQAHILTQFNRLTATKNGPYALIDYMNFKGDGLNPEENYQGHRWGLRQVLEKMSGNTTNPLSEFVAAAKALLIERVSKAPPERNEKRWLKGWHNRLDSYLTEAPKAT